MSDEGTFDEQGGLLAIINREIRLSSLLLRVEP